MGIRFFLKFIRFVHYNFLQTLCDLRGNNKGALSGVSAKKREPRRHTLQNGIDQSMVSDKSYVCL